MKKHIKRWAWRGARSAIVVAALGYIVWKVDWQDQATLAGDGRQVRALDVERDARGVDRSVLVELTPPQRWYESLYDDVRGIMSRSPRTDMRRVWLDESQLVRPRTKIEGQVTPLVRPGVKSVVAHIDWKWVACAVLIFSCNYIFLAWRLRLLLKTQDVILRRRDAVKVIYASGFLNFAVPTGTTGGDVYKAWYVSAHATGRRTEAITIVLLDRVIGLINFVFMATVVSALSYLSGRVGALGGFVATSFAISIIGSCIYFSRRARNLLRIDEWLPKLPLGQHLVRIDRTTLSLRNHPGLLVNAFAWTIVVQTIVCIAAMFLARAVGMTCDLNYGHVLDYFLAIIVGLTVSSVPGNPPQGFGVLEGIMASILVDKPAKMGLLPYGTWPHVFAVCMGVRLLHLFWALPGAIVLLIEPKPKLGAGPPDAGLPAASGPAGLAPRAATPDRCAATAE